MRKKLIAALFVTAVATPAIARADWDTLKTRGTSLEHQGQTLEHEGQTDVKRGENLYNEGKSGYDKGSAVEKKTVTTYHKYRGKNGNNYAKTTTTKVRKE